jgi:hypothetical protein
MEFKCDKCGKLIKSDYKPETCEECGNKTFTATLVFSDKVVLHDDVHMKSRPKNINIKSGDEFYRNDKQWYHRLRYIDRKDDKYIEIFRDKNTNSIVKKIEEPLSEHTGHGSAKNKKSKKT